MEEHINFKEIWEQIKNGSIDTEQLKEFLKFGDIFVNGFIDAVKVDLENSSKDYQKTVEFLDSYKKDIIQLIECKNITEEQREKLVKMFLSIPDIIKDLEEKNRKERRLKFVLILVGFLAIFGCGYIGASNHNKDTRG